MSPEQLAAYVGERLEDRMVDAKVAYGQLTVTVVPEALHTTARMCKADPRLDFDFFDFLCGVDLREEGIGVVTHLYSIRHGHHIQLRVVADGGRDEPTVPSIHDVYRGANWHEREAYDMYGIDFTGHPGLEPRILTVENFEGWPLRKEFLLSTREIKPWPGLKEPKAPEEIAEEEGEQAVRGPSAEEKAAAAKEKAERAKRKAAEMRAKKAQERAETRGSEDRAPTADGVAPEGSDAREFAERAGADSVVEEAGIESGGLTPGAPDQPAGAPGQEEEGRHTGAVEQSGDKPAAETPGMTSPTQDEEPARQVSETPAPGPASDTADPEEPASPDVPGSTSQGGTSQGDTSRGDISQDSGGPQDVAEGGVAEDQPAEEDPAQGQSPAEDEEGHSR